MSDPGQAIFLSYARDDAAAARRIAEALRASGLEVWFDENELRGGEAWDAKIRKQINDCTLFLPVISAHTQERGKGYFRLEWKLAVEQTHLMAEGMAFLAPVVIDDTREAGAIVPPEFMKVQWTRLPGALPTPQFVAQVKKLLEGKGSGAPSSRPAISLPAAAAPAKKSRAPRWTWGAVIAIVVGIATAVYSGRKPEAPTAPASAVVATPSPSLSLSPQLPAPGKSIAVLPFANFSTDKDNEFFADGLQDEVITALSKIHDLKVISRTSVLAYKNPEGRNLKKIANELGVTTILEGSVQRAGNQVHLNVQLIDARTDEHLWAETYTKELTDIFALETALAREIAGALKANLTEGEQQLLARRPTQNTEAYELYLRALVLDQKLAIFNNPADYDAALALYAQAAAKDPAFALPHVHASILHGTMYWFAALDATPERKAKALAELEAARRLAPDAPETRLAEGVFEYTCNNDWSRALEHFHAAEADLPNDARLHFHTGLAYRRLGRLSEALAQFEQAVALNPADNNTDTTLVETNFCLRRFPRVLELCTRYLELFPGDVKLSRFRLFARFELDGDRAAFLRGLPALPTPADIFTARSLAYHDAMLTGDLIVAEQILTNNHMEKVLNIDGTISDPVALHRSMLADLRGNAEDARRWADEAIAAYQQGQWVLRQEPWVQLGIARADIYAGRVEEGLRTGRAAMDDEIKRDGFSTLAMRIEYGRMLILAHRSDEALAELREMAARPMAVYSRNGLREDVIWSRLKSDPRFEEILATFKPL